MWLQADWEQETRNALAHYRQKPTDALKNWIVRAETLNACLVGTESHHDEKHFRTLVESNVCDRLQKVLKTAEALRIKSYKTWRDKLVALDNDRLEHVNEVLRITNVASRTPAAPTVKGGYGSNARATTSSHRYPPMLTDVEKELLRKHGGCYKCRHFYAGHMSSECNKEPPKAEGYRALTAADAEKACKDKENCAPAKATTAAVAALDSEPDEATTAAVACGSPPSPAACGVLGTGSDSDESDQCVPPTFSPHLTILACVVSSSPVHHSEPMRMLIDTGSSTVLIRTDVIDLMGLRHRPLHKPIKLGDAWSAGSNETSHCFTLRIASHDSAWHSRSVRALVVPSLCAPVILGMSFLSSNAIVLDCETPTCIDK